MIVLLGMAAGITVFAAASYAAMPDAKNVKEVHADAVVGCTVCHPEGNFKEVNSYGKAYRENGRNINAIKAIDALDSDADGVNNGDEINAGTNPGDAASR